MQMSNTESIELMNLVYCLTHRYRDWDIDRDDLVQIVLFKLLKIPVRPCRMMGWLRATTKTTAIDLLYDNFWIKQHHKKPFRQVICERPFDGYVVGKEEDALEAELLLNKIELLSPSHRKALKLYAAGYTYSEIASLTHQKINTVRSRIRHARMQLTKIVSDKQPEDNSDE